MTELLPNELKTYEANLESLLGSHEGKFILIYKDKILGAFDNQIDAITRGYGELGNVPFLAKGRCSDRASAWSSFRRHASLS